MKTQKTIAMVMIVAGSALIAAVFRDIAFPAILCILGLLGLQRRFTWDLPPERRFITSLLLLLLMVLFAAHYTYAGLSGRASHESIAVVAWETIACYFLASMTLTLFLGSRHRLPPTLALFYMAVVMSTGQVLLLDDYYMLFRLLEVLSVVLVVLYAAAGRASAFAGPQEHGGSRQEAAAFPAIQGIGSRLRERGNPLGDCRAVSAVLLLLALNLGWIAGTVLYRHVELLNYVPVWLWRGGVGLGAMPDDMAYVGFSDSGELTSVLLMKGDQDTTPVLRIKSDVHPGYLRAKAFDVYRPSRWSDVSAVRGLWPSQGAPFSGSLPGRMNSFRLSRDRPSSAREMMIRHVLPIRDAIFTPLGTLAVDAPLRRLDYDDDGIVSVPQDEPRMNLNYRITFADPAYAPPPVRSMLDVPPHMDPRVEQLADRIFADAATTARKIRAVVDHFQANYTYALGLSVPPGQDKLAYFLLEASTGYCEYFASGAAILLRMGGVPARYVTGFLVTEKDADGQTWVARNMDAHAWVEAWDEENRRWTIVEATVQAGLATAAADDESGQGEGAGGSLFLGLLRDNLYEYGLFGVLAWALQYHGLPAVSFLLALALSVAFWQLYRRVRPRHCGCSAAGISAERMALQRILARMDHRVKAAGARRHAGETLHAFAQRLRTRDAGDGSWIAASDWYLRYADLRYGRTMLPNCLDELTHRIIRPSRHKAE